MLITIKDLNDLKACRNQVELFQQVFGDSAEINKENILKAFENGLDVHWWCRQIFGNGAYEAAIKPLWDDYLAAEKPLWDDYWTARKPLWEAYQTSIVDWIVLKVGERK